MRNDGFLATAPLDIAIWLYGNIARSEVSIRLRGHLGSRDGSIYGAPPLGRRWRVFRGFSSGIRGWPTVPPLFRRPAVGEKH